MKLRPRPLPVAETFQLMLTYIATIQSPKCSPLRRGYSTVGGWGTGGMPTLTEYTKFCKNPLKERPISDRRG